MIEKKFTDIITVDHFCLFTTGAPGSGKTNLIKGIVKELMSEGKVNYCFCFSPTAKYSKVGGSYSFIDKKFISSTYSDEKMKKIFNTQKQRIKNNQPS